MSKNKKLRLLVTAQCPHNCPMCCNKQFDLMKLPVVNRLDYDEVMITGGEPLIYPFGVRELVKGMRLLCPTSTKFYLYTSVADPYRFLNVLDMVDGVVLTPHNQQDVVALWTLNKFLLSRPVLTQNKSLRLCLFSDIREMLPPEMDLSLWKIKNIEWKEDCPVPAGEDFCRLPNLFPLQL